MLIPDGGKGLAICAFVSIQYQNMSCQTDGQTDGFTITISLCILRHADTRYNLPRKCFNHRNICFLRKIGHGESRDDVKVFT